MSITEEQSLREDARADGGLHAASVNRIAPLAAIIGLSGFSSYFCTSHWAALFVGTHGAVWLCLSACFWAASRPTECSTRTGHRVTAAGVLLATTGALVLLYSIQPLAVLTPPTVAMVPLWPALPLTATSFWLLVLERQFNGLAVGGHEAARLSRMLKAALGATVIAAAALIGLRGGVIWPTIVLQGASILIAAVALELLVRASLFAILPGGSAHREQLGRSAIVDLLVSGRTAGRNLGRAFDERFGIDLDRSWALSFVRGSAPLAVAGILLAGWTLTGFHEIGFEARGVYERLGVPVGILGPGLHVTLPWPFGRVRSVENGAIHEVDLATEEGRTSSAAAADIIGAEDPAPASADRLWDTGHPGEVSYLIAGLSDHRQSFEAVDVDVRFVYRIRLSDEAALASVYRATDPAELVRAWGGRLLTKYLSVRALDTVLGDAREKLSTDLRDALQTDLDALGSGIEILGVVVEAIHPPSGAANAYHQVQAAEIRSEAKIIAEQGVASQTLNAALTQSSAAIDRSWATAAEIRSEAAIDEIRFGADRKASVVGGPSFLLERYFGGLSRGLFSKRLIIVDHRLPSTAMPTLDLRPAATVGDLAGMPGLLGPVAKPD